MKLLNWITTVLIVLVLGIPDVQFELYILNFSVWIWIDLSNLDLNFEITEYSFFFNIVHLNFIWIYESLKTIFTANKMFEFAQLAIDNWKMSKR